MWCALASCVFYDVEKVALRSSCEPEIDLAMCARLELDCGEVTAEDNCGAPRTVVCGECTEPAVCGGGGVENVCACPQLSDGEFCAVLAVCGAVTSFDGCGQLRTLDCGECDAPETCGGGGESGKCGCAMESDVVFCARIGGCGTITAADNCGLDRSAECGECPDGEQCVDGLCSCAPEDDASFCARQLGCGTLTASDNCEVARTVDCGACLDGSACTANRCDCTPEDDASFCARYGAECDAVKGPDNCAIDRSVESCGACPDGDVCAENECVSFPPAGLTIWLRSDVGVATTGGSNNVTGWTDQVGGVVWSAPGITQRPSLQANAIGGRPALRFFGSERLVTGTATVLMSDRFTAFVVARRSATSAEGPLLAVSASAPSDHELAYGTTPTTMRFQSDTGLAFSATVLDTSTAQVLGFRADGTDFQFSQNGILSASTPLVPAGDFTFDQIGAFHDIRGLRGDVAEILYWPRALDDAERNTVLAYLMSRYGL